MSRALLTALVALAIAAPAWAQLANNPQAPSSPGPQATSDQGSAAATSQKTAGEGPSSEDAPKSKGLKKRVKDQFGTGCTPFGCWGTDQPKADSDQQASAKAPDSAPPRSDESSSKDTKISLQPPPGEPGYAPGAEPSGDVQEMRPWDPHKAEKSIEVGDYYLREKNYNAAISRYREALHWKPNDALAQYRLGQALEAVGQYAEARKNYEGYLKILPHGKFAPDAQKAGARLAGKPDDPAKTAGPIL